MHIYQVVKKSNTSLLSCTRTLAFTDSCISAFVRIRQTDPCLLTEGACESNILQTGKPTPRDESCNTGLYLLMATTFFQEIAYFFILLGYSEKK